MKGKTRSPSMSMDIDVPELPTHSNAQTDTSEMPLGFTSKLNAPAAEFKFNAAAPEFNPSDNNSLAGSTTSAGRRENVYQAG